MSPQSGHHHHHHQQDQELFAEGQQQQQQTENWGIKRGNIKVEVVKELTGYPRSLRSYWREKKLRFYRCNAQEIGSKL